ncbi:MAG: hypothetical protein A2V69_01870 [Candidatus Portnoybacteria bacterium RBG_13_40_8]|uniref:Periplasmic copper-binding protein NosD beta helix domain-containing protein n=1 Tax=Candidatus Portnoybacteria bacterium RBG_13_40_8 TaxID=1801990 RepID=A0A1G2F504_9BACT|nr:MAG: hypothetical protein A2V69_01870 [Candidatus Portnoybacteria bacterium RBG_13_40_8]
MARKLLILILFSLLFIPIKTWAVDIIDGDLIRIQGDLDVYIVKILPSTSSGQVAEKYKRLILNSEIFNQYGHLKWENIKTVSQTELNEYAVSDLVRAVSDDKVYKLYPNGDIGEKRWVKTADDFLNLGFKWNAIYAINNFERDFYILGENLVAVSPPETPSQEPEIPSRDPITINVPNDYSTIQTAINAAIDGDTISVKSGTYDENIVLDKKIKLIGELSGSTIIDGKGNENALTINNGKDISIERFTIQSKDKYAIYCPGKNQTSAVFKNLIIKDSGWGIVAEENCQLTVLNALIYNNKNSVNTDGAGILIKNNFSQNIVSEIRNNTIDDNYHGIWSENSNLKVMNNIITNNIGGKGAKGSTGLYHSGDGNSDNTYNDVYGNGWDFGGDAKAGDGTLIVYPKFIWPSQRDYRLKTGSDYSFCIDAGHPDYTYNDATYSSNTVRNDMGAYGGPDNLGWTP